MTLPGLTPPATDTATTICPNPVTFIIDNKGYRPIYVTIDSIKLKRNR
ncbi:hypothetical protein TUM4249_05020 [Shewanella sp. KT0246]|nr:hypothetical protein TUM4249_05020 [Shewanella sp. KT0246]